MDVREATTDDGEVIREIARQSMEASYSLSPSTIENAVEKWYDPETLAEKIEDGDVLVLLVERDGEPVAFSESLLVDGTGDILWLHVDPMYRAEGIGVELFEETVDALEAAGAETVRGHVLADNAAGNAFYEDRGLAKADEDTVEIDGTRHVENVYVKGKPQELDLITGPDGQDLFVDRTDATPGSLAAIYSVYTDADAENLYGYFCNHCDSIATGMDTMGRIECSDCGNRSKPTRWDAAYL